MWTRRGGPLPRRQVTEHAVQAKRPGDEPMEFAATRIPILVDGATKPDAVVFQDARQPSIGQSLALGQSLTLDQSLALDLSLTLDRAAAIKLAAAIDRVAVIKVAAAIDRMAAIRLAAETASVETASVVAVNAGAATSVVAATNVAKPLAKRGLGLKSRSASTAGLGNNCCDPSPGARHPLVAARIDRVVDAARGNVSQGDDMRPGGQCHRQGSEPEVSSKLIVPNNVSLRPAA